MSPLFIGVIGGILTFIALEVVVVLVTRYIAEKIGEGEEEYRRTYWNAGVVTLGQPMAELREQISRVVANQDASANMLRRCINNVERLSSNGSEEAAKGTIPASEASKPTEEIRAAGDTHTEPEVAEPQEAKPPSRIAIYSAISVGNRQELKEIGYLEGECTDGLLKVRRMRIADRFDRNVAMEIAERLGLFKDIHQRLTEARSNADSVFLSLAGDFALHPLPVVQLPSASGKQTFDVMLIPNINRVASHTSIDIGDVGGLPQVNIKLHE